ncbi:DNA processing protein [Bartonella apis]|uniref:DNA-processing protein DprA n=1 Tax=Bartonella apis TaxID=1686310 RepID=UPI000964CE58|nr:DNA-processing protein DprA [Bartonella apis]OLY45088.1 DNA processing protein [Bartonella apis]
MSLALDFEKDRFKPISPLIELGAYETLWLQKGASFKNIAERFAKDPSALPSDLVAPEEARKNAREVLARFEKARIKQFGVRIHRAGDYPKRLRDATYPVEMLYYQGKWEISENSKSLAIVGSRQASEIGIKRAAKLARELVGNKFTVVSGLAKGIDVSAHRSAIENGGTTIAVIGTPLDSYYPREHKDLQRYIANNHLLISQVPVLRYSLQGPKQNRLFFPERNITMSALTLGTIIVEAGETSGTLTQARAAMKQGRMLFILDSCFDRKDITWPEKYLRQGAIRVRTIQDVWDAIGREQK